MLSAKTPQKGSSGSKPQMLNSGNLINSLPLSPYDLRIKCKTETEVRSRLECVFPAGRQNLKRIPDGAIPLLSKGEEATALLVKKEQKLGRLPHWNSSQESRKPEHREAPEQSLEIFSYPLRPRAIGSMAVSQGREISLIKTPFPLEMIRSFHAQPLSFW